MVSDGIRCIRRKQLTLPISKGIFGAIVVPNWFIQQFFPMVSDVLDQTCNLPY